MRDQPGHLESLTGTRLQELRTLSPIGLTAVVQLVKLTEGGWEMFECGGAIDREQRKREHGSDSPLSNWPSASYNQPYGGEESGLCSYLICLIVTFQTRILVVIQTSLCSDTMRREKREQFVFLFVVTFPTERDICCLIIPQLSPNSFKQKDIITYKGALTH